MDENSTDTSKLADDVNSQLGGKIMLFSVVTLMAVITFILCFHFYVRLYSRHISRRAAVSAAGARHVSIDLPTVFHRGLLNSLVKLIPTFNYSASENHPALECAVCLSEFEEGETGRVLPDCRHCFHVECIDVWFRSHSSCPICRAPVKPTVREVGSDDVCVRIGHSAVIGSGPGPVECRVKEVGLGSESPVLIVPVTSLNPV